MIRLNHTNLFSARAAKPAYERHNLVTGIVHLGIGAFHRAHQAFYTEVALAAGARGWGILGASLRSPDTRDALAPQDGLYTLSVRDGSGERLQIIGAITRIVVAPEDPEALVAAMAHRDVKIVSLTVTEKGYCHDPATGTLNELHPDVIHDLANPHQPRSAPGFIIAALALRRTAGLPPFTVLCCDNLPANGRTVKRVLTRLAQLRDPALGKYVDAQLACPCTMVDRIVPATTDEDRARISAVTGCRDAWPVVTEPFTQWVIEDHFPQGRPDWGLAGAQFVGDVAPYELMKLRLLNGAHSCIAYLGYLSGCETVATAMANPDMVRFVQKLMAEDVTPILPVPEGADLPAYCAALVERFKNPALKHRTWQIAMDGSQKLPQRLLGTIRALLAAGADISRPALGVAAWRAYVRGVDEKGAPIDVRDPLAAQLRGIADAAGADAGKLAAGLMGVEAIFGPDLAGDARFAGAVTKALAGLLERGAKESLRGV